MTPRNGLNFHNGSRTQWSNGLMLFMLSLWLAFTSAMDLTYCSTSNTGATPANSTIYQSDGLCHDFCIGDYAFAVLQWQTCWCTNEAPSDVQDVSNCYGACPGYPSDYCGSLDNGLYAYIQLPGVLPSATQGLSTSSSTVRNTEDPSVSTSVSVSSVVVQVPTTVTVQPTRESVAASSTEDSSSNTTSDTPSATPSSSTPTFTPTPILSVVTIVGQPRTITLQPTAPTEVSQHGVSTTTAAVTMTANSKGGFFSNAGRAAGVFTLIALVLVAIIALCFWILLKKRRKAAATTDYNSEVGSPTASNGSGPARPARSMSTLGLGVFSSEKNLPQIHTSSPSPPLASAVFQSNDRTTDQRLDPHQVWMRFENDNSSRVSLRSLRDDQDYSRRVLRISNPDD